MATGTTKARAVNALADALRASQPDLQWSRDPKYSATYLADPETNVLPHLREKFWPNAKLELLAGDGSELTPGNSPAKFAAAHSSSALGINSFAPWTGRSHELLLNGSTGFDGNLEFERKCRHGFAGRVPNLDVLLDDGVSVFGVESKLTEWLTPSKNEFKETYVAIGVDDPRKNTNWYRTMMLVRERSETFTYLNAAQLIKHFYGLAYEFTGRPVRVVYIYWEPANAEHFPEVAAHRAEIDRFADLVRGDDEFLFESISYPEHWRELESKFGSLDWLAQHVAAVRERYEVRI